MCLFLITGWQKVGVCPLPKVGSSDDPLSRKLRLFSRINYVYIMFLRWCLVCCCVFCVSMFIYMMSVGVLLPARCHASAGISRHRVSVCVCLVTRRYCIKTAKRRITQTRHSGPQRVAHPCPSLISANRKSTTRFLTSHSWTLCVTPKSLKGGSKREFLHLELPFTSLLQVIVDISNLICGLNIASPCLRMTKCP